MTSTSGQTKASEIVEAGAGVAGSGEDRRALVAAWLAAGSAVAYMVAVGWFEVARKGVAPTGDMIVHTATAEWLETLSWWDWRGWSDWFYGGQATGVNYPPLGYVWMRVTDPVHGQMLAVLVALLVLLPWGAVLLARAVGLDRRQQCASVVLVLALAAWSGEMHWTLSSFHLHAFWGSWSRMLASVIGLFAAALAARGRAPILCGVLVGLAALLKITVVPGIAVVCIVLVAASGLRLPQVARWAATAAVASIGVCAWWLVPFVAGWARLVHWEVPLSEAWAAGGSRSGAVILAAVALAAAGASRRLVGSRRLALAAAAVLAAVAVADLAEYQAAYHWLSMPILVAAVAAAGLVSEPSGERSDRPTRPVLALAGLASVVVFAVVVKRSEILALALPAMFWQPGRVWIWGGLLAWFGVLLFVPISRFGSNLFEDSLSDSESVDLEDVLTQLSGPEASGTLHIAGSCHLSDPWRATKSSGGRVRPLAGLNRETVASAEFIYAESYLPATGFQGALGARPHWAEAWNGSGRPAMGSTAAAEALGARWSLQCDAGGTFTVFEGPGVLAEGVTIVAHADEESWHRAAAEWWVAVASEFEPLRPGGTARIPVLWPGAADEGEAALVDRAARGVSLRTEQDRLFVTAESPGWVWVRVSWDPWWFADDGVPLKGGPGHLVVWVEPGTTELRWDVPAQVDAMAAGVTALSLLLLVAMVRINRRQGWDIDPDRPRPAADALNRLADAADRRLLAAGKVVRSAAPRRTSTEPPADDDPNWVAEARDQS